MWLYLPLKPALSSSEPKREPRPVFTLKLSATRTKLAVLSRFPSPGESLQGAKALRAAETRQQGAEDLLWALLNSPGFLFNR